MHTFPTLTQISAVMVGHQDRLMALNWLKFHANPRGTAAAKLTPEEVHDIDCMRGYHQDSIGQLGQCMAFVGEAANDGGKVHAA